MGGQNVCLGGPKQYLGWAEGQKDKTVSFSDMWINAGGDTFESVNFKVAGSDKVFYPAKARIERSKIYVKSENVKNPVAVRYAFENYAHGDLFCEDLPVSSFRSDNWEE